MVLNAPATDRGYHSYRPGRTGSRPAEGTTPMGRNDWPSSAILDDDAKNEQAMLESRIAALEEKLRSATVIDAKEISTDVVQVGSSVKIKDEAGKSATWTIVGSAEADPAQKKLSNESPVGRALIGHAKGDKVQVQLPNGTSRELTIQKIEVAG